MERKRTRSTDNPYKSAEEVDSEQDTQDDSYVESEYDVADDGPLAERRLALAEASLDLKREQARHDIKMDLMREKFRQSQLTLSDEMRLRDSEEHWMKKYWRPAMGWLYMAICAFDFIIAPILAMLMPVYLKMLGDTSIEYVPWKSITLENGGMIHLAFGAILGVAAWTRGQEKLAMMSEPER